MEDNLQWIKSAKNKLVVGSQSRILYANSEGRIKIALAFNKAIKKGEIGPIILEETIMMFQVLTHTEKHQIFMMDLNLQLIWRHIM